MRWERDCTDERLLNTPGVSNLPVRGYNEQLLLRSESIEIGGDDRWDYRRQE
jgi:hypothetical protein